MSKHGVRIYPVNTVGRIEVEIDAHEDRVWGMAACEKAVEHADLGDVTYEPADCDYVCLSDPIGGRPPIMAAPAKSRPSDKETEYWSGGNVVWRRTSKGDVIFLDLSCLCGPGLLELSPGQLEQTTEEIARQLNRGPQ